MSMPLSTASHCDTICAMRFHVRRGSQEIGGSCIEITAGDTRLVLDVGFPLFDRQRHPLDGKAYQMASTAELRAHDILPPVKGLFIDDPAPAPDAVLITHPHQDHYGLISHVKPEIPVYIGEAAAKLVAIGKVFLPHAPQAPEAFRTYRSAQPLRFGPLTVTPYLVDHSAFDAYAFLVEADGERLLYTGDFRRHGRKSRTISALARKARGVDTLLMEGTTLSRSGAERAGGLRSEADVEAALVRELKATDGLALAYASAQNIDRIVSLYRAAVRSGRTLVVDVYAATILRLVAETHPRIPHPGKFPVRVVFPWRLTTKLFTDGNGDIAKVVAGRSKVRWDELSRNPGKYLLLGRPSMKEIRNLAFGDAPLFVYSQWSGYKKEKSTKAFLRLAEEKGCRIVDIHVSGHAYPDALRDFHMAVDPKKVVPIHTLVPEVYPDVFK